MVRRRTLVRLAVAAVVSGWTSTPALADDGLAGACHFESVNVTFIGGTPAAEPIATGIQVRTGTGTCVTSSGTVGGSLSVDAGAIDPSGLTCTAGAAAGTGTLDLGDLGRFSLEATVWNSGGVLAIALLPHESSGVAGVAVLAPLPDSATDCPLGLATASWAGIASFAGVVTEEDPPT